MSECTKGCDLCQVDDVKKLKNQIKALEQQTIELDCKLDKLIYKERIERAESKQLLYDYLMER
jgi:hypothetical protein